MKRVLSLALAATLLGSTAAMAQPGWGGHIGHSYHGGHYGYYHHDGGDAAAAIGLGIFALGALAIISSQNAHQYDAPGYDDRYGPPPPDYRNAPDSRYDNTPPPPPEDGYYGDGE
jgi:hypothetical protein